MKHTRVFIVVFFLICVLCGCQSGSDKSLQATNDALASQLTAQAVANVEATSEAMKIELTKLAEEAIPTAEPTIDYLTSTDDTSTSYT